MNIMIMKLNERIDARMAILEYFPGANTPKGFYSYYDYILKSREAKRIIVLKGGPGTGKSTFMKKIAKHISSLGYETEILHCSSDPNSLDGVCAREIGFLILDGTAPHIVDPKCPGAIDEIINLGECWDKEKIMKNKDDVIKINEMISSYFDDAYKYLAAAKSLQLQTEPSNMNYIRYELEKLKNKIMLEKTGDITGYERKAFLSAFTPLGRLNYSDTFAEKSECVYKVKAKHWKTAQLFMKYLAEMFKYNGYDIRTFYCPMSPDEKIDHIYVNDMFFTVENDYHGTDCDDYVIDLNDESKPSCLDTEQYNILLEKAEDKIKAAKKLHDKLEENYVPYMNFDKVGALCESVIKSIKK